jgi:hypothetical protein
VQQAHVVQQHVTGLEQDRLCRLGRETVAVQARNLVPGLGVGPVLAARHHPHAGVAVGVVEVEIGDEHRRFGGVVVGAGAIPMPGHGDPLTRQLQHHGVLGGEQIRSRDRLDRAQHPGMAHHGARRRRLVDYVLDAAQHLGAVQVAGTEQEVLHARMRLPGQPLHVCAHRRQLVAAQRARQRKPATLPKGVHLAVRDSFHVTPCTPPYRRRQTLMPQGYQAPRWARR